MHKILIVDEDRSTHETLAAHLKNSRFKVVAAFSGKEALAKIKSISPSIVLMTNQLPDVNSLSLLEQIQDLKQEIFVIMSAAHIEMEATIQAMKAGAFEYINKPVIPEEIDIVIHKIRGIMALKRRVDHFVGEESANFRAEDIIGRSPQMIEVFKTIAIASESSATVLIEGESGTGKELIARAIHYHSNRNNPFIGINCSAMVETLLESELFGHEKGSFTGADQRKEGKFDHAENGTLLFDEVGDMSLSLQAKLLRVLQEKEFERVGGKEKIRANVRIIAATNKALEEMIKQGKFRSDLYYRLKVISIRTVPLRERLEDIPALVHHLLNKINRTLHKNVKRVSPRVLEMLMAYDWPGNVRELENILIRTIALTRANVLVEESFAPFPNIHQPSPTQKGLLSLKNLEREHVLKVLHFTEGHKGKACRILGISRPALERKIQRYQISPTNPQERPSVPSAEPV